MVMAVACQDAAIMNRRAFLAFAVAGIGLAACESAVQPQRFPEITFAHKAPIALDVAAIEIADTYRPPMAAPNVDHLAPTPPANAVRQWAADRLKAVGQSGVARLVIIDGSLTETPLAGKGGVVGAFTTEQSERYEGAVEAKLEIDDPRYGRTGFAAARATRSSTIAENATLTERETLWFDLVETMMRDFDAEMQRNVDQYLKQWVR